MCVPPKAIVRIVARSAAIAALLLVSAGGESALAESGCLGSAPSHYQQEVDAFLERPTALLDRYPAGGPAMSAHVRRLAASDASTVPALVALAADAKPAHVVALGIGLGRAAAHCAAKRPDLALRIREQVAAEGQSGLRALFSSEATVTELASGAPPGPAAPAALEIADRTAETPAAPPSTATVDAITSARPPGFLLPTNFGVPLGTPAETREAIADQSSSSTLPPSPGSGPDALFSPLIGGIDFLASRRDLSAADAPAGEDKELLTTSSAESSSIDVNRARWSSGGGYKAGPFFGSGGVTHSAQDVVSPTR